MKLYPNLVKAITEALHEIFTEGAYADVAVDRTLKSDARWGARDRKFIAGYIYDIVRWYRLYKACLTKEQEESNLYYSLFAVSHIMKGYELPHWAEFSTIDLAHIQKEFHQNSKHRAIGASIPNWLDDLGLASFGKETWEKELHYLNQEAEVYIRVNTLKTTSSKLINELAKEEVELIPLYDNLFKHLSTQVPFKLTKRKRLQQLASYKNGLFEIQDAASQLVAPFMQLQSGMKVIDACAGAGGKTLHMACLMENLGSILALDKELKKLEELERRAQRAGVRIIQTRLATKEEIAKHKASADRLLLDVPCSGLGVLKRNPDAKWKLSPDFIQEIQQTQASILSDYSTMLKQGGLMVYATCSILPLENHLQVENFLNHHQGKFELIAEQHIMPSQGFDGFFMACLKKL